METSSDVAVIGGGPCGSFTALNLAKLGFNVTVFEEHEEIGLPCHCTGHLSIKGLKNLGLYPLPNGVVENAFRGVNFYSPKGYRFSVRFRSPVTCLVDRASFDKHVAGLAEAAGVNYQLNSHVRSVMIEDGFVKGVSVKRRDETERSFRAKVVVDAEGVPPRILKQMGLPSPNPDRLIRGIQAEVEDVKNVEPDLVEVFLGGDYAPGFYAWLAPKRNGWAKVGLAAKTGNLKSLLKKLMFKHPIASEKLRMAKVSRTSTHLITLGGPISRTYSNGFLAVGDAASQAKPATGGGVILGMMCARMAAEVVGRALAEGDISSSSLRAYQKMYEKAFGFDMRVMLWIREALNAMPDPKMDKAIDFCARIGLSETLRDFSDLDLQGRSLLKILRKPRTLIATSYFLILQILQLLGFIGGALTEAVKRHV